MSRKDAMLLIGLLAIVGAGVAAEYELGAVSAALAIAAFLVFVARELDSQR